MVKVLELKGYKSLRAYNAFSALMMGLKMLPDYMNVHYEDFFDRIQSMPPEDQEKMVRSAAKFVELQKDELTALLSFCVDNNGIPYTEANIANLKPDQMIECIVAVCCEIAKIQIDFVSEKEKKN